MPTRVCPVCPISLKNLNKHKVCINRQIQTYSSNWFLSTLTEFWSHINKDSPFLLYFFFDWLPSLLTLASALNKNLAPGIGLSSVNLLLLLDLPLNFWLLWQPGFQLESSYSCTALCSLLPGINYLQMFRREISCAVSEISQSSPSIWSLDLSSPGFCIHRFLKYLNWFLSQSPVILSSSVWHQALHDRQ